MHNRNILHVYIAELCMAELCICHLNFLHVYIKGDHTAIVVYYILYIFYLVISIFVQVFLTNKGDPTVPVT